jgi:hypothetical protein
MGQLFWDVRAVVEVERLEVADYLGLEPTAPIMFGCFASASRAQSQSDHSSFVLSDGTEHLANELAGWIVRVRR